MQIVEDLSITRDQTLGYFDLPEKDLIKKYGPEKWSIRFLLNHLTDAETVLYERIRRTISKPGQIISGFDQDDWAKELDYANFPLALNKPIYTSVRNSIIFLAENYYDSLGHHHFVHNETGRRTLKDEFDKVVWHNVHHLEQIEKALGFDAEQDVYL